MIPTPPKPRFRPGTPLRVVQHVRVGHRTWSTEVSGVVESEGMRPVGGMEMGGKGLYTQQPTVLLRRPDGELTAVALDDQTEIHDLSAPGASPAAPASSPTAAEEAQPEPTGA